MASRLGCLVLLLAGSVSANICFDTCAYAVDGDCDDGGTLSAYSLCSCGTDCTDCGSRDTSGGGCKTPEGSTCPDLEPLDLWECPTDDDFLVSLPVCNSPDLEDGDLCENDGECDADVVDNCGTFEVFRVVVDDSKKKKNGDSANIGFIVGIVFAVLFLITICMVACCCCFHPRAPGYQWVHRTQPPLANTVVEIPPPPRAETVQGVVIKA